MSDIGRKDIAQKAREELTPDSQKTYAEQAKEKVTGAYDDVAKKVQPESEKGLGQTLADKGSDFKSDASKHISNLKNDTDLNKKVDEAKAANESYIEKAKELAAQAQETGSEYLQSGAEHVKSAIQQASEYVSGTAESAPKK